MVGQKEDDQGIHSFPTSTQTFLYTHRRRMEREAKAKVVASVWGADFVQFLAALAVLPRSFLEEMDEFKHVFQTCTWMLIKFFLFQICFVDPWCVAARGWGRGQAAEGESWPIPSWGNKTAVLLLMRSRNPQDSLCVCWVIIRFNYLAPCFS